MLLFKFWKRVWPHWPATPISYSAKTDKWILLLSGSNFLFLWVDKRNREFFPEKLSQRLEMCFFKNVNYNIHIWRHIVFRKEVIWTLWDNFLGKNSLFRLSTHKKKKIEPLKQNSFVGFCSVWNGRGRPVWPHPFSKLEKKHVTSFLDPFPGSVTHFTSFEGGGY